MSRLLDVGPGGLTYDAAGVSIAAGDAAVARYAPLAAAATRPEVLGGIGGFAGMIGVPRAYRDPVLVASADGVGTKLEIARRLGRYDTVGVDLVAMLVDDLVCLGAEPLFVLDYVAVGRLDPEREAALVAGVAAGCRRAGAALLGGETAEHAGVMAPDEVDLAGFAVGVLERGSELGPARVRDGDALVALASPNLRSNGFSLVRRVLAGEGSDLAAPAYPGAPHTLGDELLRPSVIYAPAVLAVRAALGDALRAAAHITGGGIVGNVARVLPAQCDAVVELDRVDTPEIFLEIQRRGPVSADEMVRVFNCGLGLVLVTDPAAAATAVAVAQGAGVPAARVGTITPGTGKVHVQ